MGITSEGESPSGNLATGSLGYSLWRGAATVKLGVASSAKEAFQDRVRKLTNRTRGASLRTVDCDADLNLSNPPGADPHAGWCGRGTDGITVGPYPDRQRRSQGARSWCRQGR